MPKTIAFCLFNYFTHGGLQRDMMRIARVCRQSGTTIRIYTLSWEGPRPEGFDVRIVPSRGWTNHGRGRHFAAQVQKLLVADPVALTVGFNRMPGLDIYFGSDVCFAEKIRSRSPLYRLTPRCRAYLNMERVVFAPTSSTHILLISPQQVRDYQKHYRLADERFTLLPPGLDDSFQSPQNPDDARVRIRKEFNVGAEDFLFLLVGSGFNTKGVDRGIRAMASLPKSTRQTCHFVVAGQGKPASYRRLAEKLGVGKNLHLAGVRHDISELMAAADVLLHPARVENTGLTLLEALACELPVLCSAACGYAPYIGESAGGVVLDEPFDQAAMNAALRKMLDGDRLTQCRASIKDYYRRTPLTGLLENAVDCILKRL